VDSDVARYDEFWAFLALYQTLMAHSASIALAQRLGFRQYAAHVAVRLPDRSDSVAIVARLGYMPRDAPHAAPRPMIKLYKQDDAGSWLYHEAWLGEGVVTEHWGRLGTRGESREHAADSSLDEGANLEAVLAGARDSGFEEVKLDDHRVLLVEYAVDGNGDSADLEKRHSLEDRLNELLGWTGLGHCDGGSIGSGTMEACCFVVDFELARALIAKALQDSEFGDYTRIYDEDLE
jgi:hypothetical protein